MLSNRYARLAAALFITAYFLSLTWTAVLGGFSDDDTMNLYRAWTPPVADLVKANVLFFRTSAFYRPLGAAWYRAIYHFAGFRPMPFHVVHLSLLALNVALAYAAARRLSRSRALAAMAALVGSFHPRLTFLYLDTGLIYDVLCYAFYFAAVLVYLKAREQGRVPGPGTLAACCFLYVCALNSKEMAVTLPAFLLAYELLWHRLPGARRWFCHEGRGVIATGLITAIFVAGRMTGANSLTTMAAYRPTFTWQRFMETNSQFFGELLCLGGTLPPALVLLLWGALFAAAWLAKSRLLKFASLFVILGVLPIAFIPPRGFAQYYIPWFGWTLIAGALLNYVAPDRMALVFATWTLMLYPHFAQVARKGAPSLAEVAQLNGALAGDLLRLHPRIAPGANLFFVNDPFPHPWQNLTFVTVLTYRDRKLAIRRGKTVAAMPCDRQLAAYDHVFDMRDGHLIELPRNPRDAPSPALRQIFHDDWSVVTPEHPLRPGERVIARATGLGATDPDTPPGHAFPPEPRAAVLARVEIRVNGRSAEVVEKFGWPQSPDTFRLDFLVPADIPPGMAHVEIAAAGVRGLPLTIR